MSKTKAQTLTARVLATQTWPTRASANSTKARCLVARRLSNELTGGSIPPPAGFFLAGTKGSPAVPGKGATLQRWLVVLGPRPEWEPVGIGMRPRGRRRWWIGEVDRGKSHPLRAQETCRPRRKVRADARSKLESRDCQKAGVPTARSRRETAPQRWLAL